MPIDSHRGSTVRGWACALALTIAPAITAHAQQAAVPVGTVYAEKRPIAQTRDFVGRVEAINRVEVRARVKGYLDAVLFKEGDIVKKGDPLYRIEKGLFQADVESAKGALERSKSAKVLTAIQLQRAQDLLDKNAGTIITEASTSGTNSPRAIGAGSPGVQPREQNRPRPRRATCPN